MLGENRPLGVLGEKIPLGVLGENRPLGVLGDNRHLGVLGENRPLGVLGENRHLPTAGPLSVFQASKFFKKQSFSVLFLRKAHSTEHHSQGCPHLVVISQLSRLMQRR